MRAAWILKSEYDIETRVVNVHTVKPLDATAIVKAAADTGVVVTAEEHQIGGFGNQVAAVIGRAEKLYGKPTVVGMVGVKDRFGESGAPWELIKEFEISAEHIAVEAKRLYDLKVARAIGAARAKAPKKAAKKTRKTTKKTKKSMKK
jgi:transketolase